MSFNVQINFTGLCVFVASSTDGPAKMCVVLPDARDKDQYALDGSWLKPHTGFVSFHPENLAEAGSFPRDSSLLFLLDRHRLTLVPKGTDNDYDCALEGIPDLDDLTGRRGALDPSALSLNPSPLVLAQVLINMGHLRAGDRVHRWVLPSTLGGSEPRPVSLSHEVRLTLQKLDSFSILAQKFGIPESEPWTFSADSDETVSITIGNLCGVVPCYCSKPDVFLEPDEDFKWHYHLLEHREVLRDLLHNALALPIPMPVKEIPAGRGANCIPAVAAPSDLTLLTKLWT
jgi:hypothetical protein